MRPVILYRKGMDPDADSIEIEAAQEFFKLVHQRTYVKENDLVIGRMSVLPFYKELELDLLNQGAKLINTYRQHQFIADMREWCQALGDLTPQLYERLQDIPDPGGPFVVKGQTNSKKHLWDTHMFARNKREAIQVWGRLIEDTLIGQQDIYVRDYVPLVRLATGFNGLPITEEFRFFVCNSQVISGGFYWASHLGDLQARGIGVPDPNDVSDEFLQEAIDRIGNSANFYTLDVALKEDGDWMVVEINDGQMAGMSCNDPHTVYKNLKKALDLGYDENCMRVLTT